MSLAVMQNVLEEFGAAVGIPDLRPDDEHRCNMMIDDVALSFELGVGDESMYIYSLLGVVPDGDAENVYAALLHANYVFAGTGGSTLSVDPQTGGIVLIREERLETLRPPRFEAVLEEFVDIAERWMQRIESGDFKQEAAVTPTETVSSTDGMMRV